MMHWCNYLFKGQRRDEMYSNVAESFNALINSNMVDAIRYVYKNLIRVLCTIVVLFQLNIFTFKLSHVVSIFNV